MEKTHDAIAVANYFIERGRSCGRPLTHLQIQKLIYFAHGWHLGLTGGPLINERIEAWDYGPVIRSVWDELKSYGPAPITKPIIDVRYIDGRIENRGPQFPDGDKPTMDILNRVWDVYGGWTGIQLSALSHEDGGPWYTTRQKNARVRNPQIDDEMIESHFKTKQQNNAGSSRT